MKVGEIEMMLEMSWEADDGLTDAHRTGEVFL